MHKKTLRIPTAQELLDAAFKAARLSVPDLSKRMRKKERWAKELEKNRIETASDFLEEKIKEISHSFPTFDRLPPFDAEWMDASINLDETKKQLGFIKKRAHILQQLRSKTIQEIFKTPSIFRIRKLSQSFYGRASSIIKKLDKDLKSLEAKRKKLLEFPNIRKDCYTIVLAGFPNVGKTTLLKKLTGSEPRIASFPFTTQGLKIGYWEERFVPLQVIDTPGLLDRPLEKRNPIEKKAVAALRHLGEVILFLVDPSITSGFSLAQQFALWLELQNQFKNKKKLVVFTKTDLASEEQLAEAKQKFSAFFSSQELDSLKKALFGEAKEWFKRQKPEN